MAGINNLLLVVVNNNGETILSETHDLFLGPEGLLRVPVRLGLRVEDLLCFPTRNKAQDPSHMGAPFSALCAAICNDSGACTMSKFVGAGYLCSSEGVLEVFVRSESLKLPENTPTPVCGSGIQESTTSKSRHHISKEVKNSMRNLCNKLCPRDENGLMLSERGKGCLKRPSWVIEEVLSSLKEEYDFLQPEIVRVKALTYMSRASLNFKRLLTLSEQDPSFSASSVGDENYTQLKTYQEDATTWRQGPYGVLWTEEHLKRKPTFQEISACAERLAKRKTSQMQSR